jgi:HPt (histidine-containing phosphotransfer) domain-containing protein
LFEPFLDIERGVAMMGSALALRRILQTVEVNLTGSIPEIDNALQDGNVAIANRLLHGIKGYAPIFCSDALVRQVIEVEGQSKTETAARMKPLFADLALKLERLLLEIRSYLAQA